MVADTPSPRPRGPQADLPSRQGRRLGLRIPPGRAVLRLAGRLPAHRGPPGRPTRPPRIVRAPRDRARPRARGRSPTSTSSQTCCSSPATPRLVDARSKPTRQRWRRSGSMSRTPSSGQPWTGSSRSPHREGLVVAAVAAELADQQQRIAAYVGNRRMVERLLARGNDLAAEQIPAWCTKGPRPGDSGNWSRGFQSPATGCVPVARVSLRGGQAGLKSRGPQLPSSVRVNSITCAPDGTAASHLIIKRDTRAYTLGGAGLAAPESADHKEADTRPR
jgi:hypothetical protein